MKKYETRDYEITDKKITYFDLTKSVNKNYELTLELLENMIEEKKIEDIQS